MTLKQSIQIFARIRPTKKTVAAYSVDHNEKTGASLDFVIPRDVTDGFVNNRRESYRFRFQKVFDQAVKQEEIFEHIARPVADSVLAGYNGTIFAYGQTGSGKTFTITGGAERYSDRGIIPRTLSYLFNRFSQESSMVYTTHISYLEIYNEMGYDLLDPRHEASRLEDLPRVLILEDPDQNIHLRNLSLQLSANEEEALNLLFLGDTNRMIAETPMNQASTRSHCIFTVHVCRREPGSATVRRSKLHLVDLAGSDRVSKTGLNGQLLTEAKFINRSLHYLEQVILALSEKNRSHIPYRNSMLTSVLRDSLGGNCTTTMIATMAVDRKNVDESISTCRFAQRVALIKNEAVLNEELDPTLLIARLKREVQMLKEELELLQGEQREEQLTEEQIHRLEESVRSFLSDPDPDVVLSPGADMRKIHFCFSMMKTLILDERRRTGSERGVGPESSDGRQNSAEVTALKKMLTQRDNEISILLQMLKKEKSRAQEAAALFTHAYDDDHSPAPHGPTPHNSTPLTSTPPKTARHSPVPQITVPRSPTPQVTDPHSPAPDTPGPQILPSQNTSKTPTLPLLHTQMDKNPTPTASAAADLEGASGQDLSTARRPSLRKEEAFEMFVKEHESRETTEDNKNLLKQRASEARGLEQRLKESRDAINELKKRLALHRRQRAAHGVAESPSEGGDEVDLLEENLCAHIDREKKAYKSTFGHLRALRIEIEHLQLLLGRARTRLNRDFQKWWSQHTSSGQTEEGVNFVSPVKEGPGELQEVPRVPPAEAELEVAVGRPTGTDRRTLPPSPPGSPLLSPGRPGPDCHPPPDVRTVTGGETVRAPLEESQNGGSTTESGWRALPSCPTSPPLTGDQQADAHILSFIKARQRLLSRTGVRR